MKYRKKINLFATSLLNEKISKSFKVNYTKILVRFFTKYFRNDYKKKYIVPFNTVLIFIYLFINSRIGFFFNGIPWNNFIETITILVIVPFFLILNKNYLKNFSILKILTIIVLIKLISSLLFFDKGIALNSYSNLIYEDIEKLTSLKKKNDNYLKEINLYKTFDSFWNKKNTAIIKKNLKEKNNFPLDWARGIDLEDWNNLEANFEIFGSVILYKDELLVFVNRGVSNNDELNKYSERVKFLYSKDNVNDLIFNNLLKKNKEIIKLNSLNLNYDFSNDWSLEAYIYNIETKEFKNPYNYNRLHVEDFSFFDNNLLYLFFLFLIILTEFTFLMILLCWIFFSWNKSVRELSNYISNKYNFIFLIFANILPIVLYFFFINYIFKIFKFNDGSYVSPLGFSFLIIVPVIIFLSRINNDNKLIASSDIKKIILLYFVSPSLFYFSIIFSYQIEYIFNYPLTYGDDWGTIFALSKIMMIYGDFVPARYCLHDINNFYGSEFIKYVKIDEVRDFFCKDSLGSIYHHNPMYRYFVCIMLVLFGHGNFSIYILDVWCILIVLIYCSYLLNNTNFNLNYIYLFCTIYLVINYIGPSRYLLGRGKEEFLAMAFIIMAIGLIYNSVNRNYFYFIFGVTCSVIALHIRLDKIFVILPLISFYFEPVVGDLKKIYSKIINIIRKNLSIIILFIFLVLLSLTSLFIRHYIILGEIYFIHPSSFEATVGNEKDRIYTGIKSIYYVLSSADFWPDKPKFPAIILFIGTFILVLLAFYRPSKLQDKVPASLSLCTICILISFFFFEPSAYPPRWSTHLLPFSTLGFIYFIYLFTGKEKI